MAEEAPSRESAAERQGRHQPEVTAAARVVGADLLSLRTIEVRLAVWPLQAGWVIVPPVRTDLRVLDVPRHRLPDVEWREIALHHATRGERLFRWRAHLPAPAWQYLPMRLQLDALWVRSTEPRLETAAIEIPGPWLFELSLPDEPSPTGVRVSPPRPGGAGAPALDRQPRLRRV